MAAQWKEGWKSNYGMCAIRSITADFRGKPEFLHPATILWTIYAQNRKT